MYPKSHYDVLVVVVDDAHAAAAIVNTQVVYSLYSIEYPRRTHFFSSNKQIKKNSM